MLLYVHRAFGHLDNVNAVIRQSGSTNIVLNDAHIRFERVTEARSKSSHMIDEVSHALPRVLQCIHSLDRYSF